MPQASDAHRDLMSKWFPEDVNANGECTVTTDGAALKWLEARGWTCDRGGMLHPPVPSLRPTDEEIIVLLYLRNEWDYDFLLAPFAYKGIA